MNTANCTNTANKACSLPQISAHTRLVSHLRYVILDHETCTDLRCQTCIIKLSTGFCAPARPFIVVKLWLRWSKTWKEGSQYTTE